MLNRNNVNRSGFLLAGGLLAGWGLFNVVEGIINHHILHLHHVREGDPGHFFDYLFLALTILLIIIGVLLIRKGNRTMVYAAETAGRH